MYKQIFLAQDVKGKVIQEVVDYVGDEVYVLLEGDEYFVIEARPLISPDGWPMASIAIERGDIHHYWIEMGICSEQEFQLLELEARERSRKAEAQERNQLARLKKKYPS